MGKKKAEKWVQEQAVLFEQQVTNGLVLDSDMLLDDLIDRWFEEYANKQLKAKTLYDYRRMRGRISAGLRASQGVQDQTGARDGVLQQSGRERVFAGTAPTPPRKPF